jgi:Domain of unknown function (DUF4249)
MNFIKLLILLSIFLLIDSCVTKFVPEINDNQDLLVVEGMITDQPVVNTIRLSRSIPLGNREDVIPLSGCSVIISDDYDNSYNLTEDEPGTYVTDPSEFCGIVGRSYTLKIFTNRASSYNFSYQSHSMEMIPVPAIDSIFYEKAVIEEESEYRMLKEGCQIYLSTYDPTDNCKYYKYDYTETWEFHIPFLDVPNRICWASNNSSSIQLKNTSVLSENKIDRFPIKFISHETDRLSIKYSMLIDQYSLNDEEFVYWDKMRNVTQDVGSLYDITPASIPGNIYCIEDPGERVLGFFSVSAKTSKRFFIDDSFSGLKDQYTGSICNLDTTEFNLLFPIPELPKNVWVVIDGLMDFPPFRITTSNINCYDCTTQGTLVEPLFWNDDK